VLLVGGIGDPPLRKLGGGFLFIERTNMPRCEDYPCCGHGTDQYGNPDCPDSKGRFTCVGCGKRLSRKATSAYCNRCIRKRVWDNEPDAYPEQEY